ncbi:MAG: hypothetical protein IPP71_03720 [Bacteroidetes bacterium]|nr:hypothetical protein [Bacteroidota bacterium]
MKKCFSLLAVVISLISCASNQNSENVFAMVSNRNNSAVGEWVSSEATTEVFKDGYTFLKNPAQDTSLQISIYIRKMFEDKAGNLWFGTYGIGVGQYSIAETSDLSVKALSYFTMKEGMSGNIVRDIVQDAKGNMWFATNGGVSRFNPSNSTKGFTNFTVKEGLASDQVWSILVDNSGTIWLGTDGGVSSFDGNSFSDFPLPPANLKDFPDAYPAPKLVTSLLQDNAGNIWFGTNGQGVYRLNVANSAAKSDNSSVKNQPDLTHYLVKDGLCSNFVQSLYEDKKGNIWISSRDGGTSCYNAQTAEKIRSGGVLMENGKSTHNGTTPFTNFNVKMG